ncbi:hypothetical protein FIU89_15385 [Roseovarius sp. THAF27]|uniref:hypothetical protein n=1 Tax=Roseovarius sp. THAF27 TaxID=2587850 RepID=UPI0012AA2F99|nr:hypothetical protein [Roseovarius sp. THAF27]QFT82007.1 hypothetical protein FIU89_15385 [Roseovarius sp. THAF27]
MKTENEEVQTTPKRVLRRLRAFRLPRPPFIVAVLTGAVIGMYFQPLPLKLFFEATGLEPGAGSSAPFAVPVSRSEAAVAELN